MDTRPEHWADQAGEDSVEKDSQGNDTTPTKKEFLKKGSRRVPVPSAEEEIGKDIQCTALISDLILTAEELGSIKRMHWSIENRLHHVWTTHSGKIARQPKSPETICRSSENLHTTSCAWHVRDRSDKYNDRMMDCFCDNATLREQYVFKHSQAVLTIYREYP